MGGLYALNGAAFKLSGIALLHESNPSSTV